MKQNHFKLLLIPLSFVSLLQCYAVTPRDPRLVSSEKVSEVPSIDKTNVFDVDYSPEGQNIVAAVKGTTIATPVSTITRKLSYVQSYDIRWTTENFEQVAEKAGKGSEVLLIFLWPAFLAGAIVASIIELPTLPFRAWHKSYSEEKQERVTTTANEIPLSSLEGNELDFCGRRTSLQTSKVSCPVDRVIETIGKYEVAVYSTNSTNPLKTTSPRSSALLFLALKAKFPSPGQASCGQIHTILTSTSSSNRVSGNRHGNVSVWQEFDSTGHQEKSGHPMSIFTSCIDAKVERYFKRVEPGLSDYAREEIFFPNGQRAGFRLFDLYRMITLSRQPESGFKLDHTNVFAEVTGQGEFTLNIKVPDSSAKFFFRDYEGKLNIVAFQTGFERNPDGWQSLAQSMMDAMTNFPDGGFWDFKFIDSL